MGPFEYTVIKIDGDYAVLKRDDTSEDILVARALLPDTINEGTVLLWENFEYSIMQS